MLHYVLKVPRVPSGPGKETFPVTSVRVLCSTNWEEGRERERERKRERERGVEERDNWREGEKEIETKTL